MRMSSNKVSDLARRSTRAINVGGPAFRLQVDRPGQLDGLAVHEFTRVAPHRDQVEIRVAMAALNFSDVLKTMGLYPGVDGPPPAIGGECVGVVTAVGEEVHSIDVGDRVLALGSGSFGSHLMTLEQLVVPIPDGLSDRQAATFGVAYLTAWHALREAARLAPGERVLIHSATGGVGLAAIGIATMIGARIYTTAGSNAKREMLSAMGVDYVGDSRSLAFAAEVLDATNGEGVDVVVNSLAGDAINAGVSILSPGGRFVELGEKGVDGNAVLGLAALARGRTFVVVDLDGNLRRDSWHYREMADDILTHAALGDLASLPVTEFQFDQFIDAFALMASGNHIGKILITMPPASSIGVRPRRPGKRSSAGWSMRPAG
jgi:phthiocerol/phenolphthiocerol synthesis type-I polyketide synthase C